MAQLIDTSAIQRIVRGARVRIRLQWALEGATTATVFAATLSLVSIFCMRTQMIRPNTGIALLVCAGLMIVLGAVISAARKLDDELVARRIDRASNLSDRLSTAIAFERVLRWGSATDPDVTHEMMHAAIRDGVRAAPRANLRVATPFKAPKDWRAALGFLVISALAAGIAIPHVDRSPRVTGVDKEKARPGTEVTIQGEHLVPAVRK